MDPEFNFEWKFLDIRPDIKSIFQKLDERLFLGKLKKLNVVWSRTMGNEVTNRNYNNEEDNVYTIGLNERLLCLRPRIDLISILLHEMIHAFLKVNGIKEANMGHGENFRKLMLFFNDKIMTNISTSHKINNPCDEHKTQWYRCTGICSNYRPFFGICRSVLPSGVVFLGRNFSLKKSRFFFLPFILGLQIHSLALKTLGGSITQISVVEAFLKFLKCVK